MVCLLFHLYSYSSELQNFARDTDASYLFSGLKSKPTNKVVEKAKMTRRLILFICSLCTFTGGCTGQNTDIATADVYVQGLKNVADVVVFATDSERSYVNQVSKEVMGIGSKFNKVGKFFGQFGTSFTAFKLFTDVVFGSVEAGRHKEVLKEFKKVHDRLDSLKSQIKSSTDKIIKNVWDAHVLHWVAPLENASELWNIFQKVSTKYYNLYTLVNDCKTTYFSI